MNFLPIVDRELRVAARRPGTYWTRFWLALLFTVICLGMLIASHRSFTPARVGQNLFQTLSVLALAGCLLTGVSHTADSISEEKRKGTLGLLFLTNLRGYDVVLGKLAVTSLGAFFGLLAVLPLLGVPFFLGGVTGTEMWRLCLLLLNTLFLSLGLGLLISAIGTESRQTTVGTLGALLLVTFGFPALGKLCAYFLPNAPWIDVLFHFPSPAYAYQHLADIPNPLRSSNYWSSMLTIFAVAGSGLALASVMLPRMLRAGRTKTDEMPWRRSWRRWRFSASEVRRRLRFKLPSGPLGWLASRDRLPLFYSWVFFAMIVGFSIWIFAVVHNGGPPSPLNRLIALFGTYGFHWILKIMIAMEACRRFSEERENGTLEPLLTAPIDVHDFIRSHTSALWRWYALPMAGLIVLNLAWIFGLKQELDEIGIVFFGGMAIVLPDYFALTRVGLWLGLRDGRYARSVLSTLLRVMAGPCLVLLLFMVAVFNGGPQRSAVQVCFALWFSLSALWDLLLIHWANDCLRSRFRAAAARDLAQHRPPSRVPPLIAFPGNLPLSRKTDTVQPFRG